jgi:hypothetical protein
MRAQKWSHDDYQRFSDRDWLRAQIIPPRRTPPPEAREWTEEQDGSDGDSTPRV